MATDYISREAAFRAIEDIDENAGARGSGFTDPERIMRDSAFYALEAIQPADVVSRDCYDRVLAENDTMRKMLAQIGKKPGDKMDDVRKVARDEIFAKWNRRDGNG